MASKFMFLCVTAFLLCGVGCGTSTPAPEIESLSLSKTTVAPGESIDVTLKVKNFTITDDHGSHDHDHAGASMGHYHVYFDAKAEVVAMATKETYSIKIPDTMEEGEHKLRVELVTTSHTTLNPTVTKETTFTVKK